MRKATFKDQDEISLGQLMEPLNADLAVDQLFGRAEVEQILEALSEQDDSVITFHSGVLVSLWSVSSSPPCLVADALVSAVLLSAALRPSRL